MNTSFDGTDIELLNKYLSEVDPRYFRDKPLYKILKTNLTRLGYWKNKPRRTPDKGIRPTAFVGTSIEAKITTPVSTTSVPTNEKAKILADLQTKIQAIPANRPPEEIKIININKPTKEMNEEEFNYLLTMIKKGRKKPISEEEAYNLPTWQQEILGI